MSPFRYDPNRAALKPLPHQEECRRNVLNALNPRTPVLLHMATGGGKTFVANDVLSAKLRGGDGYALWVTKDWLLLGQAAHDLAARHRGMEDQLARLGGWRNVGDIARLPEVSNANGPNVVYTTLHTFKNRRDQSQLLRRNPKLIVWDECHWGYAAGTGKALLKWARQRRVPVLGLTATPRHVGQFKRACFHTFRELVENGYLADYDLKGCPTGTAWSPQRSGEHADFTSNSLRTLSRNEKRNDQIVEEYRSNAQEYGKTVIFACDIEHANLLARRLADEGVAARPLHSQLPGQLRQDTLEQFKDGGVRVLVNVAMFTHGVDVPDTKTVFLCRPTASDILFSQMVGRGARLAPGKVRFHLVEFTDNADRFLPEVVTASNFLGAPIHTAKGTRRRSWPRPHGFNPQGAPLWTGDEEPEAVRGLWYREGQTFGVEFELTADVNLEDLSEWENEEWLPKARGLLRYLRDRLGPEKVRSEAEMAYHTEGYDQWKVEWDSTVGWEVVSPILEGRSGLLELAEACVALTAAAKDLGLRVNYRTGTHVHIGWIAAPDFAVRALRLVHLLEPMLRSLVPPSRFAAYDAETDIYDPSNPNDYCRPVEDVYRVRDFDADTKLDDIERMADGDAHAMFNPVPLWESPDTPHVEVRLLGGTTEAEKVLPWLSLWMRLLWAAGQRRDLSGYDFDDPYVNFPALNIQDLLEIIDLPDESDNFAQRLRRRQSEIFDIWRNHRELRAWLPTHSTRERRLYIRPLEDIALTLEESALIIPETGQFLDLDDQGRFCALWCVLLGEGPVVVEEDSTIRLCAERLRSGGWADYPTKRLYSTIRDALAEAGSDEWFDVPARGQVRAIAKVEAHTASAANRVLDEGGWQDCVLRAMSRQPDGHAPRWLVGRETFDVACKYYGIQIQNYVRSVERPIEDAIDSMIDAGFVATGGGRYPGTGPDDDDGPTLVLLVDYRGP